MLKKLFALLMCCLTLTATAQATGVRVDSYPNYADIADADELIFWRQSASNVGNMTGAALKAWLDGRYSLVDHSHPSDFEPTAGYPNADGQCWKSTIVGVRYWGDCGSGGEGGVTDHGALTGLADDDHPQYYNQLRGDARYSLLEHGHTLANISDAGTAAGANLGVMPGNVPVLVDDGEGNGSLAIAAIDLPTAESYTVAGVPLRQALNIVDPPASADDIPVLYAPAHYVPATADIAGHFSAIDSKMAISIAAPVVSPPTYSDQECITGQYAFTASHIYMCRAADTWDRIALSSWSNPTPVTYALSLTVIDDGTITIGGNNYSAAGSPYSISGLAGSTGITANYGGVNDALTWSGANAGEVTGTYPNYSITMDTAKSLTATFSAIGGGPLEDYACTGSELLCQNFNGAGVDNDEVWIIDFTTALDGAILDPDYQPALEGTHSLRMKAGGAANGGTYAVSSWGPGSAGNTDLYIYFKMKPLNFGADAFGAAATERLTTFWANTDITAIEFHEVLAINPDGYFVLFMNTSFSPVSSGPQLSINTEYHVWMRIQRTNLQPGVASGWVKVSETPEMPTENALEWNVGNGYLSGAVNVGINAVGFTTMRASNQDTIFDSLVVVPTLAELPYYD